VTTQITSSDAEQADALREPAELDEYQRSVATALTKVFEAAETEVQDIDLATARLVIFSDHHKGARDGADDFRGCERAYAAALAYYFEAGYRLFALGDAEELWECSATEVVGAYKETFELESEFYQAGRYERLWGNHDHQWRSRDEVEKHLKGHFPGIRVREALKLRVFSAGRTRGLLFLAHGHQGTRDSDTLAWVSRPIVRHFWRPLQRRLDMRSTQPSRDFDLRQRHDIAMFTWATTHPDRPVLIAGHTHRPVFWTSRAPEPESQAELESEFARLRASNSASAEELGLLRARLEFVRAKLREKGPPPIRIDPPCYFNTGCCSFGDGDVTGIEIADGEIRLVRWPDDQNEPIPKRPVKADLDDVFRRVAGR
jgi:hypothetical protein